MLGKLIKHEFRATGRIMLPLFAIVLFVSVLAHFAASMMDSDTFSRYSALRVIGILIMVLFFVGLMATAIISVVLMIQRFRTNLLGDEGYLTMTLPASVHELLWAKIIVSVVWFALTALVIPLAVFILVFHVEYIGDMVTSLREFIRMFDTEEALNLTAIVLEALVIAILSSITACLTFYASLSFGHGFAKHKMLYSVVFFFAATTVMSWLTTLVMAGLDFETIFNYNVTYDYNVGHYARDFMRTWHTMIGIGAIVEVVHGAVYYVITVLNLKKRLNLE